MLSRAIRLFFLVLIISAPVLAAGDEAPPWLQQAAALKVPSYEKDIPAVILQNEQQVTIGEDGKVTTVNTFAIRILLREGRGYAVARAFYNSQGGKARDIRAWLIRPSTPVHHANHPMDSLPPSLLRVGRLCAARRSGGRLR